MSFKRWATTAALVAMGAVGRRDSMGEESDPGTTSPPLNLQTPTLGGKQLWADELFFHEWHIQRNVVTGHYRLLDPSEIRLAWGTFEECQSRLEDVKNEMKLPPMRGKVVLTLHGLFRSRTAFNKLATYLAEKGNYTVLRVGYPSTRAGLDEHARSLASIVENLGPEVEEIDFVAHSLGNLVIRHYLGDQTQPDLGRQPDSRIKRIVMLAPPNHRPKRAELWAGDGLIGRAYDVVVGDVGRQLADGWPDIEPKLATPCCEFGILAGGRGDGQGWHASLEGDDDGTVSVTETRLLGARDFRVFPVRHTFIMNDSRVMESALRFLEDGHFESDETRQPIEEE